MSAADNTAVAAVVTASFHVGIVAVGQAAKELFRALTAQVHRHDQKSVLDKGCVC